MFVRLLQSATVFLVFSLTVQGMDDLPEFSVFDEAYWRDYLLNLQEAQEYDRLIAECKTDDEVMGAMYGPKFKRARLEIPADLPLQVPLELPLTGSGSHDGPEEALLDPVEFDFFFPGQSSDPLLGLLGTPFQAEGDFFGESSLYTPSLYSILESNILPIFDMSQLNNLSKLDTAPVVEGVGPSKEAIDSLQSLEVPPIEFTESDLLSLSSDPFSDPEEAKPNLSKKVKMEISKGKE